MQAEKHNRSVQDMEEEAIRREKEMLQNMLANITDPIVKEQMKQKMQEIIKRSEERKKLFFENQ